MGKKLPYYMAYPMPFLFDEERIERRDYEYMKSLYPDAAKRILPYVEEECDRWEKPGSMIYDEYPDRLQLRLMCRRIYDRINTEEKALYGTVYEEGNRSQQQLFGVEELNLLYGTQKNPLEMRFGGSGKDGQCKDPVRKCGADVKGQEKRQGQMPPEQTQWLHDLIEVMLYQELYRRRSTERRERRKFY